MAPTYHLTGTAIAQYRRAVRDTAKKWDKRQARIYRQKLIDGFQEMAENHKNFNSPHRDELAKYTAFPLHLVERHYIAFQAHDENNVIIAGVLYEGMNIPVRLKELQSMSRHEIAAIVSLIGR